MYVSINISGDKEASFTLHDMAMRAANPEPLWSNLAGMLRRMSREQYASDGARGPSGSWADLAPSTIAYKERAGADPRKLREWGDMYDSLTKKGDGGALFVPMKTSMVWGSTLEYFKFHQSRNARQTATDASGSTGVRLPRRAVIDPTLQDKQEMARRVRKWLRGRDMPGDSL